MDRLLVTGFGPFGDVTDNPSALLAASSGRPHRICEVSYEAVENLLGELDADTFDGLLLIGIAAKSEKMRLELVAHNVISPTPDVLGSVKGPAPIDPAAPFQLGGALWCEPELLVEDDERMPSVDAGGYLCNYIYFRALQSFPEKRVGFLHVPPVDNLPLDRQRKALAKVIEVLGL